MHSIMIVQYAQAGITTEQQTKTKPWRFVSYTGPANGIPNNMCGKRARGRVTALQFCKKGPECSSPTNERRAWVSNLWDSS